MTSKTYGIDSHGISFVARLCTVSMACFCFTRWGFHMGAAYSRCGLTNPLKIRLMVDLSWYSKVASCCSYSIGFIYHIVYVFVKFQLKSMHTPISFSHSVLERSLRPIWYWWLGLFDPIFIVTHLSECNISNHLSDQATRLWNAALIKIPAYLWTALCISFYTEK